MDCCDRPSVREGFTAASVPRFASRAFWWIFGDAITKTRIGREMYLRLLERRIVARRATDAERIFVASVRSIEDNLKVLHRIEGEPKDGV